MNYQGFFKLNILRDEPIYIKNNFEITMFTKHIDGEIRFHFVVEGTKDHYFISEEELEQVLHYVRTRDNIKDF